MGQAIVVVGLILVILGAVVAGAQIVIAALKAKNPTDGNTLTLSPSSIELPGLPDLIAALIKAGGGLAICAVGIILIVVGLNKMDTDTKNDAKKESTAIVYEVPPPTVLGA